MDHKIDESLDIWGDKWSDQDKENVKKLQGPIWVIGASGFIGAKLFFSLSRIREDVFALSRNPHNSWRLLNCPYKNRISIDITCATQVEETVTKFKPKTIFNLSAYGAYERQNEIQQIHEVNYIGTLNLIKSLSKYSCDAFVQAGTSSEYGLNCNAPCETDALEPNSDYAVAKVAVSYLLQYYGKIKNFPCTHLRLYSIYGPWEERDRLIPTLVKLGLQGKYPPLVDKNISRDFVYIDDCTRSFVLAALTTSKTNPGNKYNIATGQKTSLEELSILIKNKFNIHIDPIFGSMPNRKWDLSNWYGNAKLANEILNWYPRIKLSEGIDETIKWENNSSKLVNFVSIPKHKEKVSAIIACYKDSEAIPLMHERLTRTFLKLNINFEIIFVNDNSPYDDEKIIQKLCEQDSHVIGISHSRNFGSQNAFLSGMEIASGDAIVLLDGDLQDPPELIEEFYKQWKTGYNIVYGVRVKRTAKLYMQILYKLFYRIFKKMSDINIPLDAGDFSLLDKKCVEYLLKMPERDAFLRGLRAWIGFKQIGVPYTRPERAFGESTNNIFKNIWWAKKAIFSYSVKPLNYIQSFGLMLAVISLLVSLFYVTLHYLSINKSPAGFTTTILLILGLGGSQLLAISVLGDYIAKVLEETKLRPRFIRDKIYKGNNTYETHQDILKFMNENDK
jgi:polyisoprenyl-phosphate glycosyltransferase